MIKGNPKGFPVCFQSKFILQELEPRGCKVATNELPLCPLAQIILLCDNFPSLLTARKAVTRGLVGAEAVPRIQNLGHRRVVSAVRFPMHFVMGTFMVLVCAVILRGTRAGNISHFTCTQRLSWQPQGSADQLITPARWAGSLGCSWRCRSCALSSVAVTRQRSGHLLDPSLILFILKASRSTLLLDRALVGAQSAAISFLCALEHFGPGLVKIPGYFKFHSSPFVLVTSCLCSPDEHRVWLLNIQLPSGGGRAEPQLGVPVLGHSNTLLWCFGDCPDQPQELPAAVETPSLLAAGRSISPGTGKTQGMPPAAR